MIRGEAGKPEGPGTPAADLYSLGIVLYVLGTGQSHRDFPEPPADLASQPDRERERWLEFSAVIHRACQAAGRPLEAACVTLRSRASASKVCRHWIGGMRELMAGFPGGARGSGFI